jgi:hypothetical protein
MLTLAELDGGSVWLLFAVGLSLSGLLRGVGGAIVGAFTGGPAGAVAGGVSGLVEGAGAPGTEAVAIGSSGRPQVVQRGTGTGPLPAAQLPAQIGTGRTQAVTPSARMAGANGQCTNLIPGMPNAIVTGVHYRQVADAPPGYVVVECPPGSGNKVAMLKEQARKFGYWKPRAKPPMSAAEGRQLRRAARLAAKVEKLVEIRNSVVGDRKLVKQTTTRKK